MKRFLIVPSLVLAVLLALCILNAAALNRRTNRWMDQADRIAQLAAQQRWDMAREAMDALSAAQMALAGITSRVPPDQVLDAMREVGDALPHSLKETGKGGLAATPFGKQYAPEL